MRPSLRARRPGHGDRLRRRRPARGHGRAGRLRLAWARRAACRPSARCWSTASSRTPPRSTSTPSATTPARCSSAGSWSTSRRPACTRGDSRLRHPAAVRCRAETIEVIEDYTRAIADALDVRGLINVQYAVQGQPGLRDRGQPPGSAAPCPFVAKATGVPLAKVAARVMVGATLAELRDEGLLRRPGRRRPRRGQGGGAALQPLPRRRRRARPGDALHRRGHGHRPDRSAWPSPRASSRRATGCPSGHGVPVAGRPGQGRPASRPPRRFVELGFAIAATAGTAALPRGARASTVATVVAKLGEATGHDAVELIAAGKVDLVVNSPRGRGPRADGAHIREPRPARTACRCSPPRRPAWPRPRAWPTGPATSSRCARLQEYHRGIGADQLELPLELDGVAGPRRPSAAPVDLTTTVGSVTLAEPGDDRVGHGRPRRRAGRLRRPRRRSGAVVVKSLSAEPWAGNPPPRVHETPAGMLNSVGLQGPGVAAWLGRRAAAAARPPAPAWWPASGAARSRSTPRRADLLADAPPSVVAVEVNLSLPEPRRPAPHCSPTIAEADGRGHRGHGGLRPAPVGQAQPQHRRPGRRSPAAAREAGAEAVTLVNTVLGMVHRRRAPAAPRSAAGAAGCPARPSTRSPSAAVHDVRAALPDLPDRRASAGSPTPPTARRAAAGRRVRRAGRDGDLRRSAVRRAGCWTSSRRWCRRTRRRRTSRELIGALHDR